MEFCNTLGDASIHNPRFISAILARVGTHWSFKTNGQVPAISPLHFYRICFLSICSGLLLGCPSDTEPLKQENFQLKKQVAKLESVVTSLQEGNKAIQQQIDLLNRETRKIEEECERKLQEKEKEIQRLSKGNKHDATHVRGLEQEIDKLRRDARWLRTLRDKWRKSLKIAQKGGQAKRLDYALSSVMTAVQSTLTQNGYKILANMPTDQQAAIITIRKTSPPVSLEVTGFRNQYILTIQQITPQSSTLWVKADFEKISQNGQLLEASKLEIKEIEDRLIREIEQTLRKPKPAQKKK